MEGIQSSVHSKTREERLLTGLLFPTNFSLLLHYEGFGESLGVAIQRVGTHSKSLKLQPACFSTGYSTDSALSIMVDYAESAIIQNKFGLGIFLDVPLIMCQLMQ